MMTCKETVDVMASGHELTIYRKMILRFHLLMCPPCAKYREHLRILKAAIRKYLSAQPSLSEGERKKLEDGIIARLKEKEEGKGE